MELPVHSLPRKAYRSDLSDTQWKRIKRFLPKPKRFGRPRGNDREVINGILYVLNTGCRWEDMPHDIDASYQTCHRRLLEYQRRRIWQKILSDLMKEADRRGLINLNNAYHDASVIKTKRGAKNQVGYSGKHRLNGLKRHLVIDANGNPLNFTLSKANRHDQVNILETIDGIKIGKRRRRPKRLGLDKGYDSDPLRDELRRRRIVPIASYRSNRKIDPATLPVKERHGKRYCRQRWKVERSLDLLRCLKSMS